MASSALKQPLGFASVKLRLSRALSQTSPFIDLQFKTFLNQKAAWIQQQKMPKSIPITERFEFMAINTTKLFTIRANDSIKLSQFRLQDGQIEQDARLPV